jgi:hypothetical protein
VVSTHSDLSDIDVAVGGGNHAEILLADALTLSSEGIIRLRNSLYAIIANQFI